MSDEQAEQEEGADETQDTASTPSPKSRRDSNEENEGRLYTRVVYVRVTESEWKTIQQRALGSEFSMSRYLVQTALSRKPPPSREERARLEDLHYRFRRTAIRLRQLAALRWMQTADPETVEMIRETATLLEQLIQELTRRAYGKGGG